MALPPVYTVLVFDANGLGTAPTIIGGPPDGFQWVIVDVVIALPLDLSTGVDIAFIYGNSGAIIVAFTPPDTIGGRFLHWSGRQVVAEGDTLYVAGGAAPWSCRITAYQLSVP